MGTMTSADFNRNPTSVKRQADEGPVYITERGEPAYVVVSIDDFRELQGVRKPILSARLAMDDYLDIDLPEVEFEIPGAHL